MGESVAIRVAVAASLLAGCDSVFSIDHVSPPPPPDAAQPDALVTCNVYDEFTGTTIASHWTVFASATIIPSQNDTLRVDVAANANGEGGVRLTTAFDLRGGYVEVEVPQTVDASPRLENYIRLRRGTDASFGYVLRFGEGLMDFRTRVSGTYTIHKVRPYAAATDRVWRIQNGPMPDQVSFWTRGLDTEWQLETTQPALVAFDDIQISIVAGSYNGGVASPTSVEYDNFAVCNAVQL